MAIVYIPRRLQGLAGDAPQVEVSGATVRQVIEALEVAHPGLRAKLYDAGRDALARGLAVSVDGVAAEDGLLGRVGPDSEVHFLAAIAGGRDSV